MKISIIMTTYQGEHYLEDQLESLLCQTRAPDEVLIFDDASSDHTQQIIQQFIAVNNLQHWKMFINEQRLGFKQNFKYGMSKSQGDIIFLCDQDDRWKANKIERLVKYLEDSNVYSIASGYDIMNANGEIMDKNCSLLTIEKEKLTKVPFSYLLYQNYAQGCTMAFKKDLRDLYLSKDDTDLEHDWCISLLSAMKEGCYFLDEALIEYRIHQNNTIGLLMDDPDKLRKTRLHDRRAAIQQEEQRITFVMQYPALLKKYEALVTLKKEYDELRITCIQQRKPLTLCCQCLLGKYRKIASCSAILGDIYATFFTKTTKN